MLSNFRRGVFGRAHDIQVIEEKIISFSDVCLSFEDKPTDGDNCFANITGLVDPERCPRQHFTVDIMNWVYMLMVNILLINLLIALFSNTFEKIQANSQKIWKFYRYTYIREYYYRPPLAPPLIIIGHFYRKRLSILSNRVCLFREFLNLLKACYDMFLIRVLENKIASRIICIQ